MNIHPLVIAMIALFLTYMLILFGFAVWRIVSARPYRFIPRPPEPPDRRTGSS